MAALVPLLAMATGCSLAGGGLEPGDDAVRAAEPAPAMAGTAEDRQGRLQLPDGLLTVRVVSLEQTELRGEETVADKDLEIGDGTLVLVSWSLEQGAGLPLAARRLVLSPDVETELWLDDGEHRTRLDVEGLDHRSGAVWAAVLRPEEAGVEVIYDGVTLVLDDDGSTAAPGGGSPGLSLLDPRVGVDGTFSACEEVLEVSGGGGTCRAALTTWPWLPDLGWSEEGPWSLVRLEADGDPMVTLGGADPVSRTNVSEDVPTPASVLVFRPTATAG